MREIKTRIRAAWNALAGKPTSHIHLGLKVERCSDCSRLDLKGVAVEWINSAEDPAIQYAEFPDGLRLIFREGKYIGFYLTEV